MQRTILLILSILVLLSCSKGELENTMNFADSYIYEYVPYTEISLTTYQNAINVNVISGGS